MTDHNSFRSALIKTALITPSGALSPGPLSASAIAVGTTLGVYGGVLIALGHLAVELPYFILLLLLTSKIEEKLGRKMLAINLFAAAFILYFAYLLGDLGLSLLSGEKLDLQGASIVSPLDAFLAGVILTGANAYFLAWWISAGKPIIDEVKNLNLAQKAAVYGLHYSYDLVWLALLAYLGGIAALGGELLMAGLMIGLSIVLLYFAIAIIIDVIKKLRNREGDM